MFSDEWHHPNSEWTEGPEFDRNGDQPPRGDSNYHEERPSFGPFHAPREDERQFPPRQRPSGADMYPDERGPRPEMERLRPPGPERQHFGPPGSEMERFGPTPSHDEGTSSMPSLLDIKFPRPQPGANLKRGVEHIDGNYRGGEPSSHQFGPPPEKMPPNYGPGEDMWPGENPIPPPMGPGRGAPPFRGGPGRGAPSRGAPRRRGMRGVRGR